MKAEVMQVIRTDLELRGRGTGPDDTCRRIVQFWSLDGELLAEVDPMATGPVVKSQHTPMDFPCPHCKVSPGEHCHDGAVDFGAETYHGPRWTIAGLRLSDGGAA